jgi:hypothetical protein
VQLLGIVGGNDDHDLVDAGHLAGTVDGPIDNPSTAHLDKGLGDRRAEPRPGARRDNDDADTAMGSAGVGHVRMKR